MNQKLSGGYRVGCATGTERDAVLDARRGVPAHIKRHRSDILQ